MARGGRYSSIPLILICTRQRKRKIYPNGYCRLPEDVGKDAETIKAYCQSRIRQRGVCFSVVSEHIRRQNVAENEMNSNEKS